MVSVGDRGKLDKCSCRLDVVDWGKKTIMQIREN